MPREWDGIVSQYINRKFSRPIARFLAKFPTITPNHISILSFLIAFTSGLAFFFHRPILGGILAQFSSIMDGADGDLAAITNRISPFGGFLDTVLDRYADASILLGMICHLFFISDTRNMIYVMVGVVALIGSLLVSYSAAHAKSKLGITFNKGFAAYAASRDVRLFIVMLGGILNQIFITLLVLAILTNLTVLTRIWITRGLK